MPGRPVAPTARAAVHLSTLALPAGVTRTRYRREHHAELCSLDRHDQLPYALGVLRSTWALRRAVTKENTMENLSAATRKPLLCRLNLHHHWQTLHAPAGGNYRQCERCGKDDPGGFVEGTPDIIAGHF